MSTSGTSPSSPAHPAPERIAADVRLLAAARLVGDPQGTSSQRLAAARRFIQSAPTHGIDMGLIWGTVERAPGSVTAIGVREACLAVLGPGRTAMLFLSGPAARTIGAQPTSNTPELADVIRATCEGLSKGTAGSPRLAQALPEPGDSWAITALKLADFQCVGELAYLKRPLEPTAARAPADPRWPEGVSVRPVRGVGPGDNDRALLLRAMDRTYIDTLDCPELCGLRQTEDVLESHRAVGVFSPALWWLVLLNGEPEGCMLLSLLPELRSVELVYLGLSPALRGKGLGSLLLTYGLTRVRGVAADDVTCAVDRRNAAAITLYRGAGFREFGARLAFVKPLIF